MTDKEILSQIKQRFHNVYEGTYPFPIPFEGKENIKAILVGTDPGNLIKGKTKHFEKVFGLENNKSKYFSSIYSNIKLLQNLSIENLYIQNICKNYFNCNAYLNKYWLKIANEFWLPVIKNEFNSRFKPEIPVLLSSELIFNLLIKKECKNSAKYLYENSKFISETDNYLGRVLIPFYRHYKYSLKNWNKYKDCIDNFFDK